MTSSSTPRSSGPAHRSPSLPEAVVMVVGFEVSMTYRAWARPIRCLRLDCVHPKSTAFIIGLTNGGGRHPGTRCRSAGSACLHERRPPQASSVIPEADHRLGQRVLMRLRTSGGLLAPRRIVTLSMRALECRPNVARPAREGCAGGVCRGVQGCAASIKFGLTSTYEWEETMGTREFASCHLHRDCIEVKENITPVQYI